MFRMIKKYSDRDQFNVSHYGILDNLVVGILRYMSHLLDDSDFCTHNSSGNAQILKELWCNPSEAVRTEARSVILLYARQGFTEIQSNAMHYTFPITMYKLYEVVSVVLPHH